MNLLDCVGDPVQNFKKDGYEFYRDNRAKNTLNKVLGTEFKAVYREYSEYTTNQWSYPGIGWDCELVYILRKDNKVVRMNNSEWASIVLEVK